MDTKTQKRKRLKQLCSDYDAAVKRILTKKYVLAHIPKGCTEEFSDCSIEEIVEKYLTFDYTERRLSTKTKRMQNSRQKSLHRNTQRRARAKSYSTRDSKCWRRIRNAPLVSSSISKGNANRNCAIHAVLPSRRACRCIANSRRRMMVIQKRILNRRLL